MVIPLKKSAIGADMRVIMVPDKRVSRDACQEATLVLDSLCDFEPGHFGLPPFIEKLEWARLLISFFCSSTQAVHNRISHW